MLPIHDDDSANACTWRDVLFFWRCHNVPARMARFYWLLFCMFASIGLFFGAHAAAREWHFQFNFVLHLLPLMLIYSAHVPLLGLRAEDSSDRHPDDSCDRLMVRVVVVTVLVVLGVAWAFSMTVDRWWSDPISEHDFVYGRPPEHASPSNAPSDGSSNNPLNQLFGSASRTPSHTPTPSPDPRVLEKQFLQMSDRRSNIGALYMLSVGFACGTVLFNYSLRTVVVFT